MLELLGLAGGAIARLLPMALTFFEKGRDLKYELLRMDKEAALEKLRAENRHAEIAAISNSQVDAKWADGLVEAISLQAKVTGDKWLDRLNVSVRPILTYWHCIILFTTYKVALFSVAQVGGMPWDAAFLSIYSEFDRTLVGSIMGFWFVDRALRSK